MRLDSRVIYEGFWRRLVAGLADLVLVSVAVAALGLIVLSFSEEPSAVLDRFAERPGLWRYGVWMLAAFALVQTAFWRCLGATPGMSLVGCQVVGAKTGRRLTLVASALRSLALWAGLACLGVGVLWIIRDPRNQGLHDKLAGALVVREDESLIALEELAEGLE